MLRKHMPSMAMVACCAMLAPAVHAGTMLNGDQIRALVSGNTTFGKHEIKNGMHGYSYNRADGTYVGWNSKRGATSGKWWVEGDRMCRHRDGGKPFCQSVGDNGDGTYNRYEKLKNVMRGDVHVFTWTKVEPGNPQGL